jgi:heme-degrading monooxygenase HmoA
MIARTWRGAVRSEDGEAYAEYMERTGFAALRGTPGNLGVFGLRRVRDGRAEFVVLSLWNDESAIQAFAGDDPTRAVFYPEDERFLVERDLHVDHYEVVFRQP